MLRDVRAHAPVRRRPPAAAPAPVPAQTVPAETVPAETGLARAAIRALDVVLALLAIVVTSPLLALSWLLAWTSSAGPGLFRQERLGLDRRPFTMLKLRTMRVGTDDMQHRAYVRGMLRQQSAVPAPRGLCKLACDPRITAAGAVLRKTSLDELPQLFNVLRGEMSLVGPRPVLPWEAELFRPADELRFAVRPGITGLWQVSGRSRLSMRQALDLDAEYVRRYSLRLYLRILLRTGPALLRGGAS
jgi:lipopolysaccharide/colanic/teichoic acid biosynthesis glycosyltransferase